MSGVKILVVDIIEGAEEPHDTTIKLADGRTLQCNRAWLVGCNLHEVVEFADGEFRFVNESTGELVGPMSVSPI